MGFWSERGLGFGEPDGTPPSRIPTSTFPREVWTTYLDNRRTLFSKICDYATRQATTERTELWLVESERGIQQCHCLDFLQTPINNYAKIICSGFEFYNCWIEVIIDYEINAEKIITLKYTDYAVAKRSRDSYMYIPHFIFILLGYVTNQLAISELPWASVSKRG